MNSSLSYYIPNKNFGKKRNHRIPKGKNTKTNTNSDNSNKYEYFGMDDLELQNKENICNYSKENKSNFSHSQTENKFSIAQKKLLEEGSGISNITEENNSLKFHNNFKYGSPGKTEDSSHKASISTSDEKENSASKNQEIKRPQSGILFIPKQPSFPGLPKRSSPNYHKANSNNFLRRPFLAENTVILSVNIKIRPNQIVTFKLRRFDDLFITVKIFCDINNIKEDLMKPIIMKTLVSLNLIYKMMNMKIGKTNIKLLKALEEIKKEEN
ncbi:MAG: hypothetical protein MJ252_20720 [archaeon]|nr:hypothetical protein [archaeon]